MFREETSAATNNVYFVNSEYACQNCFRALCWQLVYLVIDTNQEQALVAGQVFIT